MYHQLLDKWLFYKKYLTAYSNAFLPLPFLFFMFTESIRMKIGLWICLSKREPSWVLFFIVNHPRFKWYNTSLTACFTQLLIVLFNLIILLHLDLIYLIRLLGRTCNWERIICNNFCDEHAFLQDDHMFVFKMKISLENLPWDL